MIRLVMGEGIRKLVSGGCGLYLCAALFHARRALDRAALSRVSLTLVSRCLGGGLRSRKCLYTCWSLSLVQARSPGSM